MVRAKAKNAKAVKALLDLDALRESKNRKDDIDAAIGKTKEENGYMFDSDEPLDNGKIVGQTNGNSSKTFDSMRAVMGLSPEKE